MTRFLPRILFTLILLAISPGAVAQFGGNDTGFGKPPSFGQAAQSEFHDSRARVRAAMMAGITQVPRGGNLPLIVVFDIDDGWKVWTNPGNDPEGLDIFSGAIRTEIDFVDPPAGVNLNEDHWQWPASTAFTANYGGGSETYASFQDRARAFLPVTIADDAPLGSMTLTAELAFQACDKTQCMMPTMGHEVSVTIEIVEAMPGKDDFALFPLGLFDQVRGLTDAPTIQTSENSAAAPADPADDDETGGFGGLLGLLSILGLGMLGGFVLNFTPCVLPVIPLKIMGLAQSGGNRRKTFLLGCAMALGIVSFFMAIGAAISSLNNFTAINQLFQYPWFAISIGVVIAVLAIGMCGMFSIRLPQVVYRFNPSHDSYIGSFFFGIMTAILSTPCTAPFMGSAAAAAVGQSTFIVLIVFGAIGAGMALPYLILSMNPKLIERMPRTGPASELIKQVMGLLLLAAAAYFIGVGVAAWVSTPPDPPSRLYFWPVFIFIAAAGAWTAWKTISIARSPAARFAFVAIGVLAIPVSVFGAVRLSQPDTDGPIAWVYYTPEALEAALADDKAVLLEFTAEWCLTCKYMEKTVLNPAPVSTRLAESDVVPMKVDLSGNNIIGNEKLRESGSITIPWLVIYRPDGSTTFQQNFYTSAMLVDAIDEAVTETVAARK